MSYHFIMCEKPVTVPPHYKPMFVAMPEGYQANNFGMEFLWKAVEDADVLDTRTRPPDERTLIPDWLSEERLEEIMDSIDSGRPASPAATAQELAVVREAQAALPSFLRFRSPDPQKVPSAKFGFNDGWIVTPEECVLIANALKGLASKRRGVDEWATFNEVAASNGGYRVL